MDDGWNNVNVRCSVCGYEKNKINCTNEAFGIRRNVDDGDILRFMGSEFVDVKRKNCKRS